jgi:hypothetical protein
LCVGVAASAHGPQAAFDLIRRRELAVCASLLGWFGRARKQLNVVGVVWIEAKPIDIGAFEGLGRGSENHVVARRRKLSELDERRLTFAKRDGSLHRPRVELYQRRIEDHVSDHRKDQQFV